MNTKIRMILGVVALLVSGIITSFFLIYYKKDWIMLLALILFAVIYVKCFKNEEVTRNIKERFPQKMLSVVASILLFIGVSLMPDSFGMIMNHTSQLIMYTVSFISWMCGLLILDIRFNR